ncbi:MAG: hypothetical protein ABSD58_10825 [Verrucomicrobiia bacterium]|jgi:hypothetical protein
MRLGPERANGRKAGELKQQQMDETTHAKEILNGTKPEAFGHHE